MPNPEIAFYADPKLWIAVIAVVLSQVPPIHKILRKGRLELDVHKMAYVYHWIGNTNLQFYLTISNVGGKSVTVKGIKAELIFESGQPTIVKAQDYIKNNESNNQTFLTKFKIASGEEWTHLTRFFNVFTKAEEKESKSFIKKAKDEITEKLKVSPPGQTVVEICEPLVLDIKNFFEKNSFGRPVNILAKFLFYVPTKNKILVKP